MDNNSELISRCKRLGEMLEKTHIPNKDRLIQKLRAEPTQGHCIHTEFVMRFHEDGTYRVTDVENTGVGYDVDIELDQKINIQVWAGASVAAHNGNLGKVSELGGVFDDWEQNASVLKKKLAQLPNDKLGILLLHQSETGFEFLPEWHGDIIPSNKCVLELNTENLEPLVMDKYQMVTIRMNKDFKNIDEVKRIISAIGYNYKGAFTFDDVLKYTQE